MQCKASRSESSSLQVALRRGNRRAGWSIAHRPQTDVLHQVRRVHSCTAGRAPAAPHS